MARSNWHPSLVARTETVETYVLVWQVDQSRVQLLEVNEWQAPGRMTLGLADFARCDYSPRRGDLFTATIELAFQPNGLIWDAQLIGVADIKRDA